jgi:hypothetical protein
VAFADLGPANAGNGVDVFWFWADKMIGDNGGLFGETGGLLGGLLRGSCRLFGRTGGLFGDRGGLFGAVFLQCLSSSFFQHATASNPRTSCCEGIRNCATASRSATGTAFKAQANDVVVTQAQNFGG